MCFSRRHDSLDICRISHSEEMPIFSKRMRHFSKDAWLDKQPVKRCLAFWNNRMKIFNAQSFSLAFFIRKLYYVLNKCLWLLFLMFISFEGVNNDISISVNIIFVNIFLSLIEYFRDSLKNEKVAIWIENLVTLFKVQSHSKSQI